MTCKENCLCYDVCWRCREIESGNPMITDYKLCDSFKDKSRIIELPCPMGSKIYMIVEKRAKLRGNKFRFVKDSKLSWCNAQRVILCFGKTVFLTREEAEKALEDWKNGKEV